MCSPNEMEVKVSEIVRVSEFQKRKEKKEKEKGDLQLTFFFKYTSIFFGTKLIHAMPHHTIITWQVCLEKIQHISR